MANILQFFAIVGKLKQIRRTGWVYRSIKDPEAVSGHMYRMAMIAMVMTDSSLNKDHCIKLCLVHDLAESIVGDIAPSDNVPKERKRQLELDAMEELCSLLDDKQIADELMNLFKEYEFQTSQEAVFVKDLDKFEMILQAKEYEDQENSPGKLQEFFDGVEGKFQTETVKELVKELHISRTSKSTENNQKNN